MGYVIAGILVLLLVAGFVTFLVMNSMRKGNSVAPDSGSAGIGTDPTPLGDTTEHAGRQSERGTTADDAERNAGEDRGLDPAAQEKTQEAGDGPERPRRPEDRQLTDAGADTGVSAPQPESERLANRPR
jgi:hypothetical protein